MNKRLIILVIALIISFVIGIFFTRYIVLNYFKNEVQNEITNKDKENKDKENKDNVDSDIDNKDNANNENEKLKALYKDILDNYTKDEGTMYTLADIDKDGIAELIIRNGNFEVEYIFYFYKLIDNKLELIGSVDAGHTTLYLMENEKYLMSIYENMGYETVSNISIENNKIKYEQVLQKESGAIEDLPKGDILLELYELQDVSYLENYRM